MLVRRLDNQKLIDRACALLYEEFVESGEWIISEDNPSKIRVISKNGKKLLVDRITNHAIWFGRFDGDELVACIRIFKATSAIPFETETYPSASNTLGYLDAHRPNLYEITRACVASKYRGRRTLNNLYLTVFEYIRNEKSSAFGAVSNPYVKNLITLIEWPCKIENAFKFEERDPLPVNFYLANYDNGEMDNIVNRLKLLENSKNHVSHITIIDALKLVAPILPAPIYWHDTKGTLLGLNDSCLKTMGALSREDIIGKTPYDFYSKDTADMIWNHSKKVILTGEILSQEEAIHDITTGEYRVHLAIKSPLYDEYGTVIGILGTSVDVTDSKEKERLEIENMQHKAITGAQEEFRKLVGKMVHDIRAPISTLQMTVESTLDIPEKKRIALRDAAIAITDITGDLLRQYEPDKNSAGGKEERQMVLVSTVLADVVSDIRFKSKDLPVKFIYEINQLNAFVFIKVDPGNFKRAISNMINNAVEALPKTGGTIEVRLRLSREWVTILIDDNGKGIPQHILDKINNKEIVTYGKKNGHGLGLTVVSDMVERNHGEFEISSCTKQKSYTDSGTVMKLRFPRATTPDWIAETINLTKNDIVVILDDDKSIHGGWDSRLNHILEKIPSITIKHYTDGTEALNFINGLSSKDKENVYLLSDYELIGQKFNGLEIIAQAKVKRHMLVTSHSANVKVRHAAQQSAVKILPKYLVYLVPIKVVQEKVKGEVHAHMVFVDDVASFTRDLIVNYYSHLITESYTNPMEFLDEVDKYSKDTQFILDNMYNMEDNTLYPIDGLEIARQLYQKGYTKLILLSGEEHGTPEYLKLVLKTDQVSISKLNTL